MNPSLDEQYFSLNRLLDQLKRLALSDGLWVTNSYRKGQFLFDQDNAPADVFILTTGLIKLLYITPDGDERIKSFIVDQGLFAAEDGVLAFGAQTIEPSTYVRLPLLWVKDRVAEDIDLQRAYGQFTDWVRQRKSRREQSLLCASPTERFRMMQAQETGLIERLPQGDIARYLGITPIAFSRIKRRLSPV
jgi:CRP/FNR family transcriptional regulator, anaerobic regulatory protein